MKYYLTVVKGEEEILTEKEFSDYGLAIGACLNYYTPRTETSTLYFKVTVLHGQYCRAFAALTRPEDAAVEGNEKLEKYARQQFDQFEYDYSYMFAIESELGILERRRWERWEEDEEVG